MGIDPATWITAAAALAGVVALILLAGRLARRSGLAARPGTRLRVEESVTVDARRRLVLVRCDGRDLLLMTGGTQDQVVGWLPQGERLDRGAALPARQAEATADTAKHQVSVSKGLSAFGRAAWRGKAPPIFLGLALLLLPGIAAAQSVAIDLGQAGQPGTTARLVQLTALIGLLSLAPSLLVMATAFARIVIVLALLRSAIGAQGVPPNPVLVGLALFLTFFVMQPAFEASWTQGILPMAEGRLGEIAGLEAAAEPFRRFMATHVREDDLSHFIELANLPQPASAEAAPYRALVPAFMVSELRRAFEIGFLLFLPFLVIDMVVASVLMSLGMMMLPPSVVALPFKLIFFVLVDGWRLVAASLVQGFAAM